MKTITYTLQCSRQTHLNLDAFLEQQRQLWNAALSQRIDAYKKGKNPISFFDQCYQMKELRESESEYSQFNAWSQRTILNRLHKSFQNFFRRLKTGENPGFPRYKGVNRKVNSFDITKPVIKTINNRKVLMIKGIGKFRFKSDELLPVVSARFVKTARRLKLQLIVENENEVKEDSRDPIGIDVGIKSQITLSNGYQKETRRRELREVKKRQRQVSKAVKGSKSRLKKKLLLTKAWQRIRERERGYLHGLTRSLIKNHSSKFFVEDLQIKNMVRNKRLSKSILEQMWGTFYQLLDYKAEDAGGWVKRVNPKNTTQRCSFCGHIPEEKIGLEVRIFSCEKCGWTLNRDINASMNILQIGESSLPGGKSLRSPGVFGEYEISSLPWSTEHSYSNELQNAE